MAGSRPCVRFAQVTMPEGSTKPVFLVDAYSDPVVVRIEGRACFSNSAALQTFLAQMAAQGKARFVIDFRNCASMDSTFLGVLAGEALELRRRIPAGSLVLCHVGRRNLELLLQNGKSSSGARVYADYGISPFRYHLVSGSATQNCTAPPTLISQLTDERF